MFKDQNNDKTPKISIRDRKPISNGKAPTRDKNSIFVAWTRNPKTVRVSQNIDRALSTSIQTAFAGAATTKT